MRTLKKYTGNIMVCMAKSAYQKKKYYILFKFLILWLNSFNIYGILETIKVEYYVVLPKICFLSYLQLLFDVSPPNFKKFNFQEEIL